MKYFVLTTILFILLLILINCSSKPAVSSVATRAVVTTVNYAWETPLANSSQANTPTPDQTNTPTSLPLPVSVETVTSEPTITNNPLPEFPLAVGNTWVYSATYSGFTKFDGGLTPLKPLTATYVITDQIVATKTYASRFGAEIQRTSSLMEGTTIYKFQNFNYEDFEIPEPRTYAYAISGTQVYQIDNLSFLTEIKPKVTRWADENPLIFEFPLVDGTDFHCWYSQANDKQDCYNVIKRCDYYWYVKEQSISLQFPAGEFDGCYTISEAACDAEVNRWFCPNIGIVGSYFLYQGQGSTEYPTVSYDIRLISYSLTDE